MKIKEQIEKILKNRMPNYIFNYSEINDFGYKFTHYYNGIVKGIMIYINERNSFQLGLRNTHSFIRIDLVETIINPKLKKQIDFGNHPTVTIQNIESIFNTPIKQGIRENLIFDIHTEDDIRKALRMVDRFVYQDALPFFDYWQDVRDFLPFIETDNIRIVANDVFSGDGMKMKMIIWWLCQHPRYEAFKKERLEVYEKILKEDPSNTSEEKEYKNLLKFLKRLEKVTPTYDWDENYLIAKPYPIMKPYDDLDSLV